MRLPSLLLKPGRCEALLDSSVCRIEYSLRLTATLSAFVMLAGCGFCGNEVRQTILSPSGGLKAVVFTRNCGATTGPNTQVSIIPAADALPDENGNALVLDGSVALHVLWRSDSALRLAGLGPAQVFKQSDSVAGVTVSLDQ